MLAALLIVIALLIALGTRSEQFSATGQPTTLSPVYGLNCGADRRLDPQRCASAGATLARVEFDVASTPRSMEPLVRAYAARGVALQPLAGFHARLPTAGEARNLRPWALRFGPRGSFWRTRRAAARFGFRLIEFGNETSYGWQYGDTADEPSYAKRAQMYARRAREAAHALQGTGVGLLVQGDDGGSGTSTWVDNLFDAVPHLDRYAAGWTIHPYGPSGQERIGEMLVNLRANGVKGRVRTFVTEWGLATDDGQSLTDNYGYPTDLTYDQAADTLRTVTTSWTQTYGRRLAQVLVYQSTDRSYPGTTRDREHFFGVLRRDGTPKGRYAAELRSLMHGG